MKIQNFSPAQDLSEKERYERNEAGGIPPVNRRRPFPARGRVIFSSGLAFAFEHFLAEDWTTVDLFGGLMDKSSWKFHSIVTEEIRARIYHQSAVVTDCAREISLVQKKII